MKQVRLLSVYFLSVVLLILMSGCASFRTPLIDAAGKGDNTAVLNMLKAGANINEQDSSGRTPLIYAVWGKNDYTVNMLINIGADVNIQDNSGLIALHYATESSQADIIKILLEKGSNIEAKDVLGWTPLMHARHAQNIHAIKCLVNMGADTNTKNLSNETPLDLAEKYNRKYPRILSQMIELLTDRRIKDTPGENQEGSEFEISDSSGMTPLMYAVAQPYTENELLETLFKKGSNIEAKDVLGWTPLMHAIYAQNIHAIKYLVNMGADTNTKNLSNETPLDLAEKYNRKYPRILSEMIELLTDRRIKDMPGENQARIYFFREYLPSYGDWWAPITINGHRICDLDNGSIFYIDKEPGSYEIYTEQDRLDFPGRYSLKINIQPREVYVFGIYPGIEHSTAIMASGMAGIFVAGAAGAFVGETIAKGVIAILEESGPFEIVPFEGSAGKQALKDLFRITFE